MDCSQAARLLSARIDGELRGEDAALLEIHLGACPACREGAQVLQQQAAGLRRAYRSCAASAASVAKGVIVRLQADGAPRRRPHLGLVAAAAGVLLAIVGVWFYTRPTPEPVAVAPTSRTVPVPPAPTVGDYLVAAPRRVTPAAPALAVGDVARTGPRERRRFALPDGSALYLNEESTALVEGPRRLRLSVGEAYVEVERGKEPLVLATPDRTVSALGTRFAVRAAPAGTGVLVAQGRVRVSGTAEGVLGAGEELVVGSRQPAAAPRMAQALAWARDLIAAADSPLVPAPRSGGRLVVVASEGQEESLSLRKFHVDVHIEDGFARTTIDQTYFNHHTARLEGTFLFPVPAGASLSRLAMYVDGRLNEGGMVEREYGRQVFESIVNTQRDPALLEWVDGTIFRMRVFPLEGRQEKRIIISYTERLGGLHGSLSYRFPMGHSLGDVRDWSFHARVKHGSAFGWHSPSHALQEKREGDDLVLDASARNVRLDGDVRLDLHDPASGTGESIRFTSHEQDGSRYLMLRYRPVLANAPGARATPRHWVFLFESSGERTPLLARAQVEVIRSFLTQLEPTDTFAVLTAATQVRAFGSTPALPVTPENVQAAMEFLERTHLIGAMHLSQALEHAAPFLRAGKQSYLVHVGGGRAGIGERAAELLVPRLVKGSHYVGIGVGRRAPAEFMKAAAAVSAGMCVDISPSDPIRWRVMDLISALQSPRLFGLEVSDPARPGRFLTADHNLAAGEELHAVARYDLNDPQAKVVIVRGNLDGKPWERRIPVERVAANAGYLPRTWARLEIDRMVEDHAYGHKPEIIKLSQEMYVMSPFTSLLVLETDEMYERFKVDRGRKDHWAMYACPEKIRVVTEGDGVAEAPAATGKPTPEQVLQNIVIRVPAPLLQQTGRINNLESISAWHALTGSADSSDDTAARRRHWRPLIAPPPTDPNEGYGNPNTPGGAMGFGFGGGIGGMMMGIPSTAPPASGGTPDVQEQIAETLEDRWSFDLPRWRATQVMRERLEQSVSIDGFEANTPLKEALGFLSEKFGFTIIMDERAFRSDLQIMEPENQPVHLQALKSVRLGTVLRLLLAQANAVYVVQRDYVEVTTAMRAQAMAGTHPYYNFDPFDLVSRTASRGGRFALGANDVLVFAKGDDEVQSLYALYPSGSWQYHENTRDDYRDLFDASSLLPRSGATDVARLRLTRPEVAGVEGWWSRHALIRESLGERAAEVTRNLPALADEPSPLLYHRPSLAARPRCFTDLMAFAPGLNTTRADILGTVEAEAALPRPSKRGSIASAARRLIDRFRASDWREVTGPDRGNDKPLKLLFDGGGRFVLERTLPEGLHEQVICDGATLWHLYPELGLGARRKVTRFHRAELALLVPWALPPVEDLAEDADVSSPDRNVVLVVPHDASVPRLRLTFTPQGWLASREQVNRAGRSLESESYHLDVVIDVHRKVRGKDSKETWSSFAAAMPKLEPATAGMIILEMPLRTTEEVLRRHRLDPRLLARGNRRAEREERIGFYQRLDEPMALELFIAEMARGKHGESPEVFEHRLANPYRTRPLGMFVLLAAGSEDVGPGRGAADVLKYHPNSPVAQYLAARDSTLGSKGTLKLGESPWDKHLRRLFAAERSLGTAATAEHVVAELRRLRDDPRDLFTWAMLCRLAETRGLEPAQREAIEALFAEFGAQPGVEYASRYEQAISLGRRGKRAKARGLLRKLYVETLAAGVLPRIDRRFIAVMSDDTGRGEWETLIEETARKLFAEGRRVEVVALAQQCWLVGDRGLARNLLDAALKDLVLDEDGTRVLLGAIDFLAQTRQLGQADALVARLFADPVQTKNHAFWRLGAGIAFQMHRPELANRRFERALDLEFQHLPDVVELEAVRSDFRLLMSHYVQMSSGTPPADLARRVVKAADRWRILDPDNPVPCVVAAQVLYRVGEKALAWDYLNTPVAVFAPEPTTWRTLARGLARQEDYELANRAYRQAAEADPEIPEILLEQAEMLEQAGRTAEARELYVRVAEGEWPGHREAKEEARGWLRRGRQ